MKDFTLKEIQNLIPNSKIENTNTPEKIYFKLVAPVISAKADYLSFIASKSHLAEVKSSKAVAFIVNKELAATLHHPLLIVENVELTLVKILEFVYPSRKPDGSKADMVVIHPSVKIGEGTSIGNFVSIGANSIIGKNCLIEDGVKIADSVEIGDDARIGMNCVFSSDTKIGKNFIVFGNSTFGGDGFKFITLNGIHHKVPQVGKVIIGNDVEIGSNCTVDRGGLADTIIGDGCKFDNMVHIGHNVIIGNNVIIAGQSGVAGSTKIADGVLIGGGCCISDHLELPEGTVVAGGTGMRTSPKKPDVYIGWDWGMTFAEFQKARVNIKHLVGFNKWASRIKTIENKLGIVTSE